MTYLVVLIQPEECEVGDTNRLPMILDLLASTIDYMRHFIGNNEFQVLIQTIYPARGYKYTLVRFVEI